MRSLSLTLLVLSLVASFEPVFAQNTETVIADAAKANASKSMLTSVKNMYVEICTKGMDAVGAGKFATNVCGKTTTQVKIPDLVGPAAKLETKRRIDKVLDAFGVDSNLKTELFSYVDKLPDVTPRDYIIGKTQQIADFAQSLDTEVGQKLDAYLSKLTEAARTQKLSAMNAISEKFRSFSGSILDTTKDSVNSLTGFKPPSNTVPKTPVKTTYDDAVQEQMPVPSSSPRSSPPQSSNGYYSPSPPYRQSNQPAYSAPPSNQATSQVGNAQPSGASATLPVSSTSASGNKNQQTSANYGRSSAATQVDTSGGRAQSTQPGSTGPTTSHSYQAETSGQTSSNLNPQVGAGSQPNMATAPDQPSGEGGDTSQATAAQLGRAGNQPSGQGGGTSQAAAQSGGTDQSTANQAGTPSQVVGNQASGPTNQTSANQPSGSDQANASATDGSNQKPANQAGGENQQAGKQSAVNAENQSGENLNGNQQAVTDQEKAKDSGNTAQSQDGGKDGLNASSVGKDDPKSSVPSSDVAAQPGANAAVQYAPDGHPIGDSAIDENGIGHFSDDDAWHPWTRTQPPAGGDASAAGTGGSAADADQFAELDSAAAALGQQQSAAMDSFEQGADQGNLQFQLRATTNANQANMQRMGQMTKQAYGKAASTLATGVATGVTIMATQYAQQQQAKAEARRRQEQARAQAASASASQSGGLSGQTRKVNYNGIMLDVPVEVDLQQNGSWSVR